MSTRVPVIDEISESEYGFAESGKYSPSAKFGSQGASGKQKLTRKGSETEQRLSAMRERFAALQLMEEANDKTERDDYSPSPVPNTASARWNRLRKVVKWPTQPTIAEATSSGSLRKFAAISSPSIDALDSPRTEQQQSGKLSPRSKRKVLKRPSEGSMKYKLEEAKVAALELDDVALNQIWTDGSLPELPEPPIEPPTLSIVSDIDTLRFDMYTDIFQEAAQPLKVTVNRIPEEVVHERKADIERQAQEERLIMLEKLRQREEDIDFRETTAREALKVKEQEARRRLDAEKQKVASLALKKQRALAQDFRKMREDLEQGIKKQHGAIKENFGRLLIHEETLARRFHAASKMAPQPIEFRIHLLRAVKNKLPKGVYVLMLTQYDSIGGRPLSWSRIGANGIGNMRPGLTRLCRHEGRYFDRILRVEDSCFALCPPRPILRPNFVFVLELFQLASKHNPFDKIEAWTAVPMTYESMSIIEGKFKLPMMRGEHSPAVTQFKEMETLMASDLHNWLCNIYIEVRHMSLAELGATDEMLKTTDFDMDYFNKSFIPLDVEGNPILSRAQQQQRALERDLEAAGFGASAHGTAVGGVKLPVIDENDPAFEVPLLPVDKGIFRRKSAHGHPTGAVGDEEMGLSTATGIDGKEGGTAAATTAAGDKHGDMAASSTAPEASSKKVRLSAKASRLSRISEEKGDGSSSHSLLAMLGLKSSVPDPNRPLLLKNDDNFMEHRKLLVQRWKDNIRSKGLDVSEHGDSFREEKEEEVLERGYNIQDEVFLHREQRGKIAGVETISPKEDRQWAGAGLEGKIVRRWQSEGPRYDSEAIGEPRSPSQLGVPRANSNLALMNRAAKEPTWEELRDPREMEAYTMAICTDAGKKKGIIPGAKSASKLRYIYMELFGDFNQYLWGTFEFYMGVFIYLFALWIRIYVHYLAQYLYLLSLRTPVFGFRMMVFQVVYKYMSASISVAAETGVVAIGPIANLCVFLSFVALGHMFHKIADYLPEVVSKFFAAFGIAAVLDPLLVIIIDLIYHNYNCLASSDACQEDYTSSECNCFNGDFLKLWYRMEREEGSGLTGLFITVLLYMGTGIVGCLMLYQYIVYVHRDGRILDQWRRLNGTDEEFFIPDDFEVSDEELKAIIYKGVHWRGPSGARRRLETETYTESDPADAHFGEMYKKYILAEFDANGHRSVYREFVMEPSGAILEIFESRNASYNPTSIFNAKDPAVDQTDKEETGSKEDDDDGAPSEHTGLLSARRSAEGRGSRRTSPRVAGGSPRGKGAAGSGAAFPDLLSSLGAGGSTRSSPPTREQDRAASETAPLLRTNTGGGSRRGLTTHHPRDLDEEEAGGEAFF